MLYSFFALLMIAMVIAVGVVLYRKADEFEREIALEKAATAREEEVDSPPAAGDGGEQFG